MEQDHKYYNNQTFGTMENRHKCHSRMGHFRVIYLKDAILRVQIISVRLLFAKTISFPNLNLEKFSLTFLTTSLFSIIPK